MSGNANGKGKGEGPPGGSGTPARGGSKGGIGGKDSAGGKGGSGGKNTVGGKGGTGSKENVRSKGSAGAKDNTGSKAGAGTPGTAGKGGAAGPTGAKSPVPPPAKPAAKPPVPAPPPKPPVKPAVLYYLDDPGLRRLAIQPVVRAEQSVGNSYCGQLVATGGAAVQPLKFATMTDLYLRVTYAYPRGNKCVVQMYNNCQINGLFYIGSYRDRTGQLQEHKSNPEVDEYWAERARRQFGWHVYCRRMGASLCATALKASRDVITAGRGRQSWTEKWPLDSLYPTVRLESRVCREWCKEQLNRTYWTQKRPDNREQNWVGEYWLTLGLVYDGPPTGADFKCGDRYYAREGKYADGCRKWGHVYELTDQSMDALLESLAKEPKKKVQKSDSQASQQSTGSQSSVGKAPTDKTPPKKGSDSKTPAKKGTDSKAPAKKGTDIKALVKKGTDSLSALKKGIASKISSPGNKPSAQAAAKKTASDAKPFDLRRWAVYVCAGAKLLVADNYAKEWTPGRQNRALVQQGGVVAGRGELVFGAPVLDEDKKFWRLSDIGGKAKSAKHGFALDGLSDAIRAKLANIKNPVVFLGPLESEYGSIAWNLDVTHPDLKKPRVCALGIPEGAWFVAIEEWDVGVAEIQARHQYEQLHRSNVQMAADVHCRQDRGFQVPDKELAVRIVGVGDDRSVGTNILAADELFATARPANAPERTPLPVLYRCRRMTEWEHGFNVGAQPPMPPDWPLIKYGDLFQDYRKSNESLFMANDFAKTRALTEPLPAGRLYGLTPGADDSTTDTYTVYEPKGAGMELVFPCTKLDVSARDLPYGTGTTRYMGIDGWVYNTDIVVDANNSTITLGNCQIDYYQAAAAPSPLAVPPPVPAPASVSAPPPVPPPALASVTPPAPASASPPEPVSPSPQSPAPAAPAPPPQTQSPSAAPATPPTPAPAAAVKPKTQAPAPVSPPAATKPSSPAPGSPPPPKAAPGPTPEPGSPPAPGTNPPPAPGKPPPPAPGAPPAGGKPPAPGKPGKP